MTIATSYRMHRLAGGAVLTAAMAALAMGAPGVGHADPDPEPGPGPSPGPNMGCEIIHWGLFGNDRRQICDGPEQPDGTWQRTRTIFTPPHLSYRHCDRDPVTAQQYNCQGGDPIPLAVQARESYPVAPDTVLPDEPGWLPPYTDNVF